MGGKTREFQLSKNEVRVIRRALSTLQWEREDHLAAAEKAGDESAISYYKDGIAEIVALYAKLV